MSLFDDVDQDDMLAPPSDLERALDMYDRLATGGSDEILLYTVIPGVPPSKARPRFRRMGKHVSTYTDPASRTAEARTADQLRHLVDEPMPGNVALGCVFFRPDRQRIDTDNMLKHVSDAANGVLWHDDSQVTAVMGVSELDAENPRTIVVIGRHTSSLARGADDVVECKRCGTPFLRDGRRKTCSSDCAMAARGFQRLDELVQCARCGTPFKRVNRYQKLCSRFCAIEAMRDRNRGRRKPFSRCVDCDTELTHHRGGRCRECWRAMVGGGS